ncbi:MAG: [protein-PII] uridylyltransferase [Planctomycetaceae bacterium]|nr:[protein-PII] uridylyltransferase [Planctomycetaceae bacterium]
MSYAPASALEELSRRKAMFASVRDRGRALFDSGTPGVQVATAICSATEDVVLAFANELLEDMPKDQRERVKRGGAIVAVGGTGRGELAPYSDVDLLCLHERSGFRDFEAFVSPFAQNCWDAGMTLGNALRDIPECIALGKQDPQVATSLVEARFLWGNERLFQRLESAFYRKVVACRKRKFIESCLEARSQGWSDNQPLAQELEPDIKNSAGGLRDLHLLRWIGFARYQVRDIDGLRMIDKLSREDSGELKEALEFLTRLRIDLHFHAKAEQDRLTRDEQLRITKERGFVDTAEQRDVEQFMQQYFHHSSQIAEIVRRFAALERPRSYLSMAQDLITGHHCEGNLYVGTEQIDVAKRHLPKVCQSLDTMISLFRTSALYEKPLSPRVMETIKSCTGDVPRDLDAVSAKKFMEIFHCTRSLGPVVRSMFRTGLLDVVIPNVTHIRNLLQFNQYHYFTVDEHTLRAIETITGFERDDGPIGTAYNSIRNKEVLHLAVLLHDIGKGFKEDHCIVGEGIAHEVGARLHLPQHQTDELALLVRKHLVMADVAFKRDLSDPKTIIDFSHEIGSPETLKKLYCLTVADITAVGPGTWTNWKAGLLTELYDKSLVILSGKRYGFLEQERIREIKEKVAAILYPDRPVAEVFLSVDKALQGCSANYLTTTSPAQIAADLRVVEGLDTVEIAVSATWWDDTGTTEYRVITRNPDAANGCFHKLCGVLAAKRLEILSADINTTTDGVIIDSYQVLDPDFAGEPPETRFEEVEAALKSVLAGDMTVKTLLQRGKKFGGNRFPKLVSGLPDRVGVDNESSETRTIVDIFAHDRPGLLYTLARTLFELDLSVDMAKIATHFDQVADVFYVQEQSGEKVQGEERIRQVKETLLQALKDFEDDYRQQFERK